MELIWINLKINFGFLMERLFLHHNLKMWEFWNKFVSDNMDLLSKDIEEED